MVVPNRQIFPSVPNSTPLLTESTEPPWYVIRMPGGVGGEGLQGPSLSRLCRMLSGAWAWTRSRRVWRQTTSST